MRKNDERIIDAKFSFVEFTLESIDTIQAETAKSGTRSKTNVLYIGYWLSILKMRKTIIILIFTYLKHPTGHDIITRIKNKGRNVFSRKPICFVY